MITINRSLTLVFSCWLLSSSTTYTKMHEYVEDAYAMQAPQEIVALTEEVAQIIDFNDPYEIVIPKKPGLQINPWNRFVSYGTNPQTQNKFVLVNPSWFADLNHDEQIFLLGRCFMTFKQGKPLNMQILPYVWILFIILAAVLLFVALGRTRLSQQKIWVRVIIVYAIIVACNLAFLNSLQLKLLIYLGNRYDQMIHTLVLEKTGNKEAAINALERLDESIAIELNNGELFFAPYNTLFADYAKALKDETK